LVVEGSAAGASCAPVYAGDLFAPEALRDPFEHYRTIRDLGPTVWLECASVFAIARFEDLRAALRAPESLISGEGVGFNTRFNAPSDHPPVIRRDGESHWRLRRALLRSLAPAALRPHRQWLKSVIAERVEALVGAGPFEAVEALARRLPLEAVAHLVGLGDADRAQMLHWASASFNAIGPMALDGSDDPGLMADLELQVEVRRHLVGLDPSTLRPGSWAASLFEAVREGEISLPDAHAALSGLVLPSLDTTINAKANLLHALATHPDQWRALKADPSLIPAAVQEGMRYQPVVRWFSRVAVEDYPVDGVQIPAGARVMLLYGAANRDERHYPEPDRFSIRRDPTDHLGWGTGPHLCAGAHLARVEIEVMLEALVAQVERLEVNETVRSANRGLHGFERLMMRLD
jgi:cytochrome P450